MRNEAFSSGLLANSNVIASPMSFYSINDLRQELAALRLNSLMSMYKYNPKKATQFDLDGFGGAAKAYLSRDKTDWADWLAWASMAVAACWMICDLAKLVVSLA